MSTWSDAFSGRSNCTLYLDVTESSTNSGANTSVVSYTLRIVGNNTTYGTDVISDWSVTIDGTTYTGKWGYNFTVDNTVTLKSSTKTITHATNGSKSITVYGSATDNAGSLGTASITSKTFTLTDFVRVPSAPGTPSLSRSGSTVTASTSGATFYGTGGSYSWQYSIDGGSTWTADAETGTSVTIACGSTTATCYVRVLASDSEGSGSWSSTASIVGVPVAPSTITATRTGRNVNVVAGTASGTGVNAYYVQASADNGSTWGTAYAMSSQSYTYSNLTPGSTYKFRVYATNSIGSSATTTSASVFIPAGGKRWDTSVAPNAWAYTSTAKRWNGSTWVDLTTAKRWNGSAWVDLS